MSEGDDKALVEALLAGKAEAGQLAPLNVDLDHGQFLVGQVVNVDLNVNWNVQEQLHNVAPEMAALQIKLKEMECASQEKVADLTYAEPARIMTRPVWAIIIALAGAAGFLFSKEQYGYGVLCLGGMAVSSFLDALAKKLRGKSD